MAGEIQFNFVSGAQTYFQVRNGAGQVWNTANVAFQAYQTANVVDYAVAAVEQGSASSYYAGTFPSAIAAGVYNITAKRQLNASPQENDPTIAQGDFQWSGTAPLPLSDLATSGQVSLVAPMKVYRGQMVQNFPFKLVSSLDHITPFVSGIVSGQISRDGGSLGPLQSGAFSEIGKGWYSLQALTSGDLLGNTVALLMTANGVSGGTSDQRDFSFLLQKTSGQA